MDWIPLLDAILSITTFSSPTSIISITTFHSPTSIYFGDYALNMLWCSACASTSSHDVMSAHNDVYIGGGATLRMLEAFPSADIHAWLPS
jgi:hypothetical protein